MAVDNSPVEEPITRKGFRRPSRFLAVGVWTLSAVVLGAVLWRHEMVRQIIPALAAGPLAGFLGHTFSGRGAGSAETAERWRRFLEASLGSLFFLGIVILSRPAFIVTGEGLPFSEIPILIGIVIGESLVLGAATVAALEISERAFPATGRLRFLFRVLSGAAGCAMIPWVLGIMTGESEKILVFLVAYLGVNLAIASGWRELRTLH